MADKEKTTPFDLLRQIESKDAKAKDILAAKNEYMNRLKEFAKDQPMEVQEELLAKGKQRPMESLRVRRARQLEGATPRQLAMVGDAGKTAQKAGKDALKKAGKKVGKKFPVLAGLMSLGNILTAEDAAAATEREVDEIPDMIVPGGLERLGPEAGSPEATVEDPTASPEERERAMRLLMNRWKDK